jgi:CO dehydrogenase/acetyl-CoA synthase beta subunit
MTVKQHLEDRVNAWLAKQLWDKISTELEVKMRGELADEHVRFPWIQERVKELLSEYLPEKIRKRTKDEEKIED